MEVEHWLLYLSNSDIFSCHSNEEFKGIEKVWVVSEDTADIYKNIAACFAISEAFYAFDVNPQPIIAIRHQWLLAKHFLKLGKPKSFPRSLGNSASPTARCNRNLDALRRTFPTQLRSFLFSAACGSQRYPLKLSESHILLPSFRHCWRCSSTLHCSFTTGATGKLCLPSVTFGLTPIVSYQLTGWRDARDPSVNLVSLRDMCLH